MNYCRWLHLYSIFILLFLLKLITNSGIFAVFNSILAFVLQLEGSQLLSRNVTTLKRGKKDEKMYQIPALWSKYKFFSSDDDYRNDLNIFCTDAVNALASLCFCHLLRCASVKLWGKQHLCPVLGCLRTIWFLIVKIFGCFVSYEKPDMNLVEAELHVSITSLLVLFLKTFGKICCVKKNWS